MTRAFYTRLHWGDYHKGTSHLRSAAEHGAYLLLIGALTTAGGKLKADDDLLARLACCTPGQWRRLKPIVLPFFQVRRGTLSHKRVSADLAQIGDTSGKRKQAGRAGGLASALNRKAKSSGKPEANAQAKPTKTETETDTPKLKSLGTRRCPADWAPAPEIVTMALGQPDLGGLALDAATYDLELAKFRDHEFAKPRKDWSATFRNWLREAADRKHRHAQHRSGPDARQAARHDNYAAAQRGADLAAGRPWDG